nr:hypothetical protein [Pandoravirus massiliensis]
MRGWGDTNAREHNISSRKAVGAYRRDDRAGNGQIVRKLDNVQRLRVCIAVAGYAAETAPKPTVYIVGAYSARRLQYLFGFGLHPLLHFAWFLYSNVIFFATVRPFGEPRQCLFFFLLSLGVRLLCLFVVHCDWREPHQKERHARAGFRQREERDSDSEKNGPGLFLLTKKTQAKLLRHDLFFFFDGWSTALALRQCCGASSPACALCGRVP